MGTNRCIIALAVGCLLAGCQTRGAFKTSPKEMEEAASARSQIVGMRAPDFSLKDQNGKTVTLSSLKGQWVALYFFPQDDTPGCTCEATEFTRLIEQLKGMNARVYGISKDSVATHQVFVEKFALGVNLLSDPDRHVMRAYGACVDARLGDKTYERVIRTTVIIDPEGVIRYHWPEVMPQGHAQRVREKLAELQGQAQKPPHK
jgi:thioredoxin-dependent peroxiredoxin